MTEDVARVAIVGTESTGKSALAAGLARHFDEPWAQEYVRAFWDERRGGIEAEDLATIAQGQIDNEEAAARVARQVVFCDTDLLANVHWADELYDGAIAPWVRVAAEERMGRYTLYLYCEPDLEWEPDPQRVFAERDLWLASAKRCWARYSSHDLPLVQIRGRGEERLQQAIAVVVARLKGQLPGG